MQHMLFKPAISELDMWFILRCVFLFFLHFNLFSSLCSFAVLNGVCVEFFYLNVIFHENYAKTEILWLITLIYMPNINAKVVKDFSATMLCVVYIYVTFAKEFNVQLFYMTICWWFVVWYVLAIFLQANSLVESLDTFALHDWNTMKSSIKWNFHWISVQWHLIEDHIILLAFSCYFYTCTRAFFFAHSLDTHTIFSRRQVFEKLFLNTALFIFHKHLCAQFSIQQTCYHSIPFNCCSRCTLVVETLPLATSFHYIYFILNFKCQFFCHRFFGMKWKHTHTQKIDQEKKLFVENK